MKCSTTQWWWTRTTWICISRPTWWSRLLLTLIQSPARTTQHLPIATVSTIPIITITVTQHRQSTAASMQHLNSSNSPTIRFNHHYFVKNQLKWCWVYDLVGLSILLFRNFQFCLLSELTQSFWLIWIIEFYSRRRICLRGRPVTCNIIHSIWLNCVSLSLSDGHISYLKQSIPIETW